MSFSYTVQQQEQGIHSRGGQFVNTGPFEHSCAPEAPFLHKRRLEEDQDLYVREGDFVLYGDFFYEIVKLSEPKKLFGQVDHGFEISARCRRARKGLFDAT